MRSKRMRRCALLLDAIAMIQSQVNGLSRRSFSAVVPDGTYRQGKYGSILVRNIVKYSSAWMPVGSMACSADAPVDNEPPPSDRLASGVDSVSFVRRVSTELSPELLMEMSDRPGGDAALLLADFWFSGNCASSLSKVVEAFPGCTPARSSATRSSILFSSRFVFDIFLDTADLRLVERRVVAGWRHSLSRRWHL